MKKAAFPTSDCGLEDCFSVPQSQCGHIQGPAISLWLQAWSGRCPLFTQFQDCVGIWHHTVLWGKTGKLNKQGMYDVPAALMSVSFLDSCKDSPQYPFLILSSLASQYHCHRYTIKTRSSHSKSSSPFLSH